LTDTKRDDGLETLHLVSKGDKEWAHPSHQEMQKDSGNKNVLLGTSDLDAPFI